jgi:hypothetical protein
MQVIAYLKKRLSWRWGIMRSADAGKTWRDVTSPQSWAAVRSTNDVRTKWSVVWTLSAATLLTTVSTASAVPQLASIRAFSLTPTPAQCLLSLLSGGGGVTAPTTTCSILYTGQWQCDMWTMNYRGADKSLAWPNSPMYFVLWWEYFVW